MAPDPGARSRPKELMFSKSDNKKIRLTNYSSCAG